MAALACFAFACNTRPHEAFTAGTDLANEREAEDNTAGTYFAMAILKNNENDIEFCQKLIMEKKVAVIPTSAFYMKSNEGSKMIRFCFAKTDETLKKALDNLTQ